MNWSQIGAQTTDKIKNVVLVHGAWADGSSWDKVIPLFTKGVYPDGSEASTQGVAPYTILYATGADGQKFASAPTEWLTGIPTITNADTISRFLPDTKFGISPSSGDKYVIQCSGR